MSTFHKEANKTDWVFPFTVLLICLINIGLNYNNLLSLSVLNSLLGITGIILFFNRIDFFRVLIYLWIFVQIVIVEKISRPVYADQPVQITNVWNLTQAYSFWVALQLGTYILKLNFIPLFMFGLLKFLELTGLVGKTLTFTKFRAENSLGDVFPFSGKVIKRVKLDNESDWLLVQLDSAIEYEETPVSYILVKHKERTPLRPGAKNQIVFVRLVYEVHRIWKGKNNKESFPFIDWALCT